MRFKRVSQEDYEEGYTDFQRDDRILAFVTQLELRFSGQIGYIPGCKLSIFPDFEAS